MKKIASDVQHFKRKLLFKKNTHNHNDEYMKKVYFIYSNLNLHVHVLIFVVSWVLSWLSLYYSVGKQLLSKQIMLLFIKLAYGSGSFYFDLDI